MKTAIFAALSAVPRWLWLLIAGVVITVAIIFYGHAKESAGYTAGYEKKTEEIRLATAAQNDANRKKEQDLNEQIAHLQQNNQQLLNQLAADKRSADQRVTAFSLQLEKTRRLLADAAASADASVNPAGKTAYQTAGMLVDVLGKSVERNRILAAYADDARTAGELCEQQYDQVRKTINVN